MKFNLYEMLKAFKIYKMMGEVAMAIIQGSVSFSFSGRKRQKLPPKSKNKNLKSSSGLKRTFRRETPEIPSAPINSHNTGLNENTYKKEVSAKYTVAPAYNKGAYQVISSENVEHIGK